MSRRSILFLAAAIAAGMLGAGAGQAMFQDAAAALRASGQAGEQADGYLGVVGGAGGSVRGQVDAINIKRRAYYTELAAKRGAKIEEVAATTGCELLRTKVAPGQFYRGTDGAWRQRGDGPVPLPSYCG
jgi:uncharacterized protein YdbL (DUF1318 family)